MAKFIEESDNPDGTRYIRFSCPGCNNPHVIPVSGPKAWGYNENAEKPTLTPSILRTLELPDKKHVCHSFVTDGRIQYLTDCTHALAGLTVDLPEITDENRFYKAERD